MKNTSTEYRVQEFNLEKLNLLEVEKQRIRKDFERKEAQIEASKKMYVPCTPTVTLALHTSNRADVTDVQVLV